MPAAMAGRIYPFPFRTRKSSAPAPMVLPLGGRVGRRRLFLFFLLCGPAAPLGRAGPVFFPLPPALPAFTAPATAPPEKVSGGRSRAASSSAPRGALFNVLRRLRGKKPGGCPASAAGESARAVPDKLRPAQPASRAPALALRALAALPRWGQQRRRRRSGARRRNGTRSRGQPGPGRETPG